MDNQYYEYLKDHVLNQNYQNSEIIRPDLKLTKNQKEKIIIETQNWYNSMHSFDENGVMIYGSLKNNSELKRKYESFEKNIENIKKIKKFKK